MYRHEAEPKDLSLEEGIDIPNTSGRSENLHTKQSRYFRCYLDEGVLHLTSVQSAKHGILHCMLGRRHDRDNCEHHMRLDLLSLGNLKWVRTVNPRPTATPPQSTTISFPNVRRAYCIIPYDGHGSSVRRQCWWCMRK
jgi:hypothetical protein